ncbi:MAG: zinc-ribbon domain containing protein [Candidatus Peribacteraceae bacterium]
MADQQLQCRDCGGSFTFTDGEQEFYNSRGLSAPQRCKDCRQKRKNERLATRQMYPAVCAKCGSQCEVPFKPRPVEEGGKPVLCKDCFFKEKDAMAS